MTSTPTSQPVKKRIISLDALRGFALLGIAAANFPEFSLWTFLDEESQLKMKTGSLDIIVRAFQYMFVDGKFYTIFSILFGIGFSIIISHAMEKGANGFRIFYRRMVLLLLIGLFHLLFIWSGDILMLYAAVGMLLPLFRNCKPKTILKFAVFFLTLPILVEILRTVTHFNPADLLYSAWWQTAYSYGINENNFASWLLKSVTYSDVHAFLMQGAVERMWEFVLGQRYFKVLGLFLFGYYIGKQQIFKNLDGNFELLTKVAKICCCVGLPLSMVYVWSSMSSQPLGQVFHTIIYTFSVYPLGIAYMSLISIIYVKTKASSIWRILAYPGRMALTCYILQSIFGIIIFYGIGFGFGMTSGLFFTEIVAILVFTIEIILSALWLKFFNFGPLEWIWRMLTYGKVFKIRK